MLRVLVISFFLLAPWAARAESVKPAPVSACICPFLLNVLEDAAIGHFVVEPGTRIASFVVETPLLPDAAGRMRERGELVVWGSGVQVAESIKYFVFGKGGRINCAEQVAPVSSDPGVAAVLALDCSGGHSVEATGRGMCVERVKVSEVLRLAELRRTDPELNCEIALAELDGEPRDGCAGGAFHGLELLPLVLAFLIARTRFASHGRR